MKPMLRFLLFAVGGGLTACSAEEDRYLDRLPGDCESLPVLTVFRTQCSNGGCHVTGGQYPELTAAGLSTWMGQNSRIKPSEPLVVPGNPEASFLLRKVNGAQGSDGGALMPLGAAMPAAEAAVIREWIAGGAPSMCNGSGDPGTATPVDPNTLNQAALFTCADPTAPRSSVARIRRIDRPEWTHAVGAPDGSGSRFNLTAAVNPFSRQASKGYSTYSEGLTVDDATLDLYFLNLPEAGVSWNDKTPRMDNHFVDGDSSLNCFWNTAKPTPACIDNFVTKLLQVGVLSRTPTGDEILRLKDYAVAALAREPGGGQTGAPRSATSYEIAAAAWLTTGALFRSELGTPVPGDAAGRRRLSSDELALALGSVLSTHRPGSPVFKYGGFSPPAPDDAMPALGWLQGVRTAANNGTLQDPAVVRSLIAAYGGGIDPSRRYTLFDYSVNTDKATSRGEFYLGTRIAGFFREWLDYSGSLTVFKDTPGGTSRFMAGSGTTDRTSKGYVFQLGDRNGWEELNLAEQLDDTIARMVVESAATGKDVFAALLTELRWRLPSDQVGLSTQTCTNDADCTGPKGFCNSLFKVCGSGLSNNSTYLNRVYNVEGVPETDAGRWVTMSGAERSGVLTHPAWLAAHGGNFEDDASLVHRGKWVREKLFCQTVPGLENVMVQAKLGAKGPSARQRVDEATVNGPNSATCLGCHRLMNPLGYPFEIYDHAGFVRATDHGRAPDGSTTITNAPDPTLNGSFKSAIDFSKAIAGSPYARRCFIRQAFRYFAGRDETLADACTLTAMENALASGSFFDMLTALTTSDTFLYRTVQGGAQ